MSHKSSLKTARVGSCLSSHIIGGTKKAGFENESKVSLTFEGEHHWPNRFVLYAVYREIAQS
jgi:hypothetical protein